VSRKGERHRAGGIRKEHALRGEAIDVRGIDVVRPVARDAVGPQRVDGDEDDVEVPLLHAALSLGAGRFDRSRALRSLTPAAADDRGGHQEHHKDRQQTRGCIPSLRVDAPTISSRSAFYFRRMGCFPHDQRNTASRRMKSTPTAFRPTGQATSHFRQYTMTSQASSMPIFEPSRTSTSASFWSISCLQIDLS